MTAHGLFLVLHVLSNLVWIGSITAVGLLIAKSAAMEGAARAAVAGGARSIYRTLAAPAFGLSFIFGIALIAGNPGYFKQPWFHAKLTAALIVIALHHVIGARAKRAEAGTLSGDGAARVLTLVLLVAAAGAVVAVVLKP